MQATDYLETAFLNHWFRNTAFTKPTRLDLSYWDSDPGEAGTGATEIFPFGAGVREALTFSNSSSRQTANTNAPQTNATGSGTANYLAIQDQSQNMLCYQEIQATPGGAAQPMVFTAGQPIQVAIGAIEIRFLQESSPEECHSDTIVDEWLSLVFGSGSSTPPANHFLSLHSSDPGETGTGELTGGGYVRTAATWNVPSAGASNRQQTTNTAQIDFLNLQQNITWWGVWSLASGGVFLTRSDQTDQIITSGDNASAAAGALAILAG